MEELYEHQDQPGAIPTQTLCRRCQQQPALEGVPNPFCQDCREAFIRYPVPQWIWAFAGGVLALMIIGFVRMGSVWTGASHLKKAERAMDAHRYITASNEAQAFLKDNPASIRAHEFILEAAIYNWNDERTREQLKWMSEHEEDINDVDSSRLNTALSFLAQERVRDTVSNRLADELIKSSAAKQLAFLESSESGDVLARAQAAAFFASEQFDRNQLDSVSQILYKSLNEFPDFYQNRLLEVPLLRRQRQFDKALHIADSMLVLRPEDINVMTDKSRVYLAMHDYTKASQYAREALKLSPQYLPAKEAMAIVYHYTGKQAAALDLMADIHRVESAPQADTRAAVTDRLQKILNGTETFQ